MQSMDKEFFYIEKAKKGNGEAFGELVRYYENFVYNTAYGFLLNPHDAFDVAQDSFLKAWKAIDGFKGNSSFSTWLYRITVNTAKDALALKNKERHAVSNTTEDGEIADIPCDDTPEKTYIEKEERERLISAVEALDEDMKEIIVLREFNDLSYDEISSILEIELGTVKSRLFRARGKLKEMLLEQKGKSSVKL